MINFSFIIPHKNTPDLLQKCIDSIPRRDDVQIIVVDDNSDSEKVDFDHFPGLDDSTVEVYLTKEGRGAGYARNVGLSHASGKWIVFADADDFFLPEITTAMDDFNDSDADVIFFKGIAMNIVDGGVSYRGEEMNRRVDIALKTGDFTQALTFSSPWKKFFRADFLTFHSITFNEVRWSNDVVFMAKVARYAEKCLASPMEVYCITESSNSLVKCSSLESQIVRLKEECKEVCILRHRFKEDKTMHYWLFRRWFGIYKRSKVVSIRMLPYVFRASGWHFIEQVWKAKFE